MNEFSKIKFKPRNKYKLMKETNFVLNCIKKIRPILNPIFDELSPVDNNFHILENNGYVIYIALTDKSEANKKENRIGCLGVLSKLNEIVIVLYDTQIKNILSSAGSTIPDSYKYHLLFETLIHEMCHLYIEDEDKTNQFCKLIMNNIGISTTY